LLLFETFSKFSKNKFPDVWDGHKPHHYKITGYGEAKYNFSLDEHTEESYYVKFETSKGKETILWGKHLRQLMEDYNITNGEPKTFKYLIETTLKGLGEPIRYRKIPAGLVAGVAYSLEGVYRFFHLKAEPPLTRYTYYLLRYSQTLDIQKAQTELGYYPKMTIEEGIDNYVQHDQAH